MNANRIRLNADPKEYSLFSTVRFIHPVDEKIRAVRVEISRRIDRFGAQEVEDTEVIELVDEGADDDGCRSEQHERKSEVPELFKCIRAVQFCRLVHVFICVGKDPRRQKHDGRNADPRANRRTPTAAATKQSQTR